jgi:hypothetical protein
MPDGDNASPLKATSAGVNAAEGASRNDLIRVVNLAAPANGAVGRSVKKNVTICRLRLKNATRILDKQNHRKD